MNLIFLKIFILLLLIYLPGHVFQLIFWRFRNQGGDKIWELEDIIFLRVLIGFSFLTFAGLLLVWIGLFTLAALVIFVLLCYIGNLLSNRYLFDRKNGHSRVTISLHQIATLSLLITAFILWFRPSEYIFGGWDPGVYINYGVLLAKSGSMDWHNEAIRLITPEQQSPFYHIRHGMNQLYPGFILSESETGKLIPYFLPTYPIWIAIFYMIFGMAGVFYTTVFISILGLWTLYSIGKIIWGRTTALMTGALALSNVGMLYFSGFPNAESLSRLFLLGSIYGFIFLAKRRDPAILFSGLGILCLVLAFTVKYTPFVLFPAFLLYLLIGTTHIQLGKRLILSTILSGVALATFYINHATTTHHAQLNIVMLSNIITGLQTMIKAHPYELILLVIVLISLIVVWWRWRRKIWIETILSVGATFTLSLLIFLQLSGALKGITLIQQYTPSRELGWYLSWPGLVICILGLWFLVFKGEKGVKGLLIFSLLIPSVMFAIRQWDEPFHFWAGRRLMETIIPIGLILIGSVIATLLKAKGWRKSVGALLIIVVIIPMIHSTKPILFRNDYSGAGDFIKEVSQIIPKQGVVITSGGWWMLATPMNMIYGVKALQFSNIAEMNTDLLIKALLSLLETEIPIYYITDVPPAFTNRIEFKPLNYDRFETKVFEHTHDRLPRNSLPLKADLYLYEVKKYKPDPYRKIDNIHIDIGSNPFGLKGFSFPRRYAYPSRFFRWTGGSATLKLNTEGWISLKEVTVICASRRPRGVPAAYIKLYVNGYPAASFEVPSDADFAPYTFKIPDHILNPETMIRLDVTCWSPRDALKSQDDRILGLQIEALSIKGRNRKGESVELNIKAKNLPLESEGWYSPEAFEEASKEYRYIGSVGIIQIPWSRTYQPKTLKLFAGVSDITQELELEIYLDDQFVGTLKVRGDFREYRMELPKGIKRDADIRELRLIPKEVQRNPIKLSWIELES